MKNEKPTTENDAEASSKGLFPKIKKAVRLAGDIQRYYLLASLAVVIGGAILKATKKEVHS